MVEAIHIIPALRELSPGTFSGLSKKCGSTTENCVGDFDTNSETFVKRDNYSTCAKNLSCYPNKFLAHL